jgi:formylglycine-generating enzyme required for sulfatase activity
MRLWSIFAVALWVPLFGISASHAEKRVALVIGNSDYRNVTPLPNPVNDATDISASLERLGFKVKTVANASFEGMRLALSSFAEQANGAEIAVAFFAGHGMESGGENRLIPVDAKLASEIDISYETIPLQMVMRAVSNTTKVGIVILDACRNNPFQPKKQQGDLSRTVDRGFARVEPSDNVLVAYAARDGTTAKDGSGRNSPFTTSLLKNIETPGLEIQFMFRNVRDDVMAATNKQQQPFVYGSLSSELIYLKAATAIPPINSQTESKPRPASCEGAVLASVSLRRPGALTAAEECALTPKAVFRECIDCPEMVVLPSGSFMMGSSADEKGRNDDEGPQHRVEIPEIFAVGRFHVTVDQFAAFVRATGYSAGSECRTFEDNKFENRTGRSWQNPGISQTGAHPATCLSWNDARSYVAWLSKTTDRPYRLLSEAEWEYAARAGTTTRYYFGDDERDMCRYGNGLDETAKAAVPAVRDWDVLPCKDGFAFTSPVGTFPANAFGLADMLGNASTWVADCQKDSYLGAPSDSSAVTSGDCARRMLRGGSWISIPRGLRSAYRSGYTPSLRFSLNGLRVARTLR